MCLEIAVAAGLHQQQVRGGETYCICPWHHDNRASLRINAEKDVYRCDPCNVGGTAYNLIARLADCDPADRSAVAKWRDARALGSNEVGTSRIAATYDYRDEANALLYQVVRFEPKT